MTIRNLTAPAALIALSAALAGCNLTGAMEPPPAFPSATGATPAAFVPNSAAGLPVTPESTPNKLATLVAVESASGKFGQARSDPFALTTEERSFETQQEAERLFAGLSPFTVQLTQKPVAEDLVVAPEPQPYRRLSGIVVGDSILAILEEQGKEPIIVTPGMRIPNTEWRVVSIDQDKAILRRNGKVKPNEVIVRLETPRFGTETQGGVPGGNQGGGYPGGGYPGGGYPGGGSPGGIPGGGRSD